MFDKYKKKKKMSSISTRVNTRGMALGKGVDEWKGLTMKIFILLLRNKIKNCIYDRYAAQRITSFVFYKYFFVNNII